MPDLALAAGVLTFLYALFLYDGPRKLYRDSDTGWHIRTGERILDTTSLPRTDPYSFSRAGSPWFAWEWGADVLMGASHRIAGLTGVAFLYLLVLSGCTWLWFRLHWAAGGDFLLACAMAAPMLTATNLHWLARPHVIGWALMLVWLLWVERVPGEWSWRRATGVAALGALWANLHASFFLLPAIALLYVCGALLSRDRQRALALGELTLCGAFGTLLNPYGWNLHRHVAAYLTDPDLMERIAEFQSFNFHAEGATQILLVVAIAGTGAVLAFQQRAFGRALLLAAMTAVALRSARGLPVLALLLPLANASITKALPRYAWLRYSANLRALEFGFRGYALAPVLAALGFAMMQSPALTARTGFSPDEFPVAAAAEVAGLPETARILHPDKFGGYLIYAFDAQRKVFFDGRSDFYGSKFLKDYIDLVQLRPGWREQLRAHGFTHALVPTKSSLAGVLPLTGWREMWRDSTAVLLERAP